jgi:DNA topoisomerase IA
MGSVTVVMRLVQTLYEAGYISYMRMDSTILSASAESAAAAAKAVFDRIGIIVAASGGGESGGGKKGKNENGKFAQKPTTPFGRPFATTVRLPLPTRTSRLCPIPN